MRKKDKHYYKNWHHPTLEKTRTLKSLKHKRQSLSKTAYWNYVEELIKPQNEQIHDLQTVLYFNLAKENGSNWC